MDKPARAISIRQPYAEQILRGTKRYEYRSVPTNIRERVYIYASLKLNREDYQALRNKPKNGLPTGVLVGTVEITDCEYLGKGKGYAYKLARPRRLARTRKPQTHAQPIWFYPFGRP